MADPIPTDAEVGAETISWRWGELFELDLPEPWTRSVQREQGTVSFAAPGGHPALQISLLERVHGSPETGVAGMVEGFARAQGLAAWSRALEVTREGSLVRASGRFEAGEGAWAVHVVAWARRAVLLTAWDEAVDTPGLELADRVLSSIRVLDVTRAVDLEPDPPGEF